MAEHPTLQSVGACALIALHADPSSPLHEIGLTPDKHDYLTTFLEEIIFTKEATHDLVPLINSLRLRIGEKVASLLKETLAMAAESLDSLMDLVDSLRIAVVDGVVDAVSAQGVYLRRFCLAMDALTFESMALFWRELKTKIDRLNSHDACFVDSKPPWPFSNNHWELKLDEDYSRLPTRSCTTNESFESIELRARELLVCDPELPGAYFLRFMNCLRHDERAGALDALHQYFDYSAVKRDAPKDILQFSAILLAMTHNSFGDNKLALSATYEAVRVAQQSKDAACVAFALGWLFENSEPWVRNKLELVERCCKRSRQGQLRSLLAGASLILAKDHAQYCCQTSLVAWTSLSEVVAEPNLDSIASLDRPTLLTEIPQDAMRNLARQLLATAGIWDVFGMSELSRFASSSALRRRENLSSVDTTSAIRNIARIAMYGSGFAFDQQPKCSDALVDDGQSIYCAAIRRLDHLNLRSGSKRTGEEDCLMRTTGVVCHELATRKGDLVDASVLTLRLNSHVRSGMDGYLQFVHDVNMQNYHLKCRQSDWDEARNILSCMHHGYKANSFRTSQARMLVQLASLLLESNPRQVSGGLAFLLDALSLAGKSYAYGLHSAAMIILAKVLLRLKNPVRALGMMKAVIPTLTEREHIWLQGEAFLIQSKCHFELATTNNKLRINKRRLVATLKSLGRSEEMFWLCQDFILLREVFYLKSQAYSALQQTSNREAAAQQFVDISCYLKHNSVEFPFTSMAAIDSGVFHCPDEAFKGSRTSS